ncbi:MAG: peptidase M48, partial [Bacteroidetes bacterium]|nr:peptidase M48 [Bacteroidota bacterium]
QHYALQSVNSSQLTIHGNTAIEVIGNQVTQEASGETPAGTPTVKVKMTLIQYGDLIYQLTGVSAFEDFNSYAAQFNGTMSQFKKLTDPEKLNRQPKRLRLYKTTQSKSLRDQLTDKGIPNDRLDEWAIVNGMELTDIVSAGTTIKVLK